MGLNTFLTFSVVIIGLVVFYIRRKFSYWKDRGFAYVEPKFPLGNINGIGISSHFADRSKEFYEEFKNKAKILGIYFFVDPSALILDLDIIKQILVKDFNNFHDRGFYVNKKDDPLSGHLFSIEGQEWKNMRAKLTPTFTSGKMKMMFDPIVDICKQMITHLKKNPQSIEIEMKDILARFTTDVIGNVAFGLDLNSMVNPDSMFRKMGRKVFEPPFGKTLKVFFILSFQRIATMLGLMITDKDVTEFFLSSMKETVEYRESNNVKRNDFLNLLLQIKKNGKIDDDAGESIGGLTLEQLTAQSYLFFLAGFETSSTTMTFTIYELALNPDVQEKLRDDIQNVLARHDGKLTYESMLEMKYLQMVIDETLRKYPPVDNLIRIAANDYKVPGTNLTIEKGTRVFIPAYAIQRDSSIYPDPMKYDPERFTDENKKNRHPMAHLPFGEGPRNCVGLRFGLMQTKIGLINLLTNFKFSPGSRTTIPMKLLPSAALLSPIDNMWLTVEKL